MRRVEFEHQRLHQRGLQVSLPAGPLAAGLRRRLVVTRSLVLVVGSLGLAFATQRGGLTLGGALCLFLGALPVLWAMGSFTGALLSARRLVTAAEPLAHATSARSTERVTLELGETHLRVLRAMGDTTRDESFLLRDVRMHRLGTDVLIVTLQNGALLEHLQVPLSAFASSAEFDAFCLELQGALWSAERRA